MYLFVAVVVFVAVVFFYFLYFWYFFVFAFRFLFVFCLPSFAYKIFMLRPKAKRLFALALALAEPNRVEMGRDEARRGRLHWQPHHKSHH